ncbi:MAG: hypothetical protein WCF30_01865 [Terracidiphilus sp.]
MVRLAMIPSNGPEGDRVLRIPDARPAPLGDASEIAENGAARFAVVLCQPGGISCTVDLYSLGMRKAIAIDRINPAPKNQPKMRQFPANSLITTIPSGAGLASFS